jgi:8-oxo-dGTP diphosphatase
MRTVLRLLAGAIRAARLSRVITRTCLCLVRRQTASGPEVLLGLKKTGFGAGKWVGLGGHIEDGEKPETAAVREVMEESGLAVPADSLQHMAHIEFRFPARPSWDQTADVYLTWAYDGEAAESSEISPRWFGQDELPFALMWDDARYWWPVVLAGQHVTATVTFADDCATVAAIEPRLPA